MIELDTVLTVLLPLSLLGAVCGLDMVSFPQAMIARPIVSATVAGLVLGEPAAGVLIGAVLELIALETLPFGASRYAEWGSAGVVGGSVYALQPEGMPAALPMGMLAALVTAFISSWSMVAVRKLNGRTVRALRPLVDKGSAMAVAMIQLRGLTSDLLRGGFVTLLALLALLPLADIVVPAWTMDGVHARAVVTAIAATVAASAVWHIFHTIARAGWLFLLGLIAGGLLLWMQR